MSDGPASLIQAVSWIHDVRNDPRRYRALAEERLGELDVSEDEVGVLRAVQAGACLELMEVSDALRHAEIAVKLASSIDDAEVCALVHCILARCYVLADRVDDAARCLDEGRGVLGGEQAWQFDLTSAALLYKKGQLAESLAAIERSLEGVPLNRPEERARAHNGRGILKLYLESDSAGLHDLVTAERLYLDLGRELDAADVTYNKAMALGRLGDLPGALQAFEQATIVLEAHGESVDQLLVARGQVLLLAGLMEDVVDELPGVVERLEAAGMLTDAAEGRIYLAAAQLAVGDPGAAATAGSTAAQFEYSGRSGWAALAEDIRLESRKRTDGVGSIPLDEAVAAAVRLDDAGMRTFARTSWLRVAGVAQEVGDRDRALDALQRVSRRRATLPERADAYRADAWICVLNDDLQGARRRIELGLRLIERNRSLFNASELRAHASGWGQDLAALLVETYWNSDNATDLLTAAERWRAGTMTQLVSAADDDPALDLLLAEYRSASILFAESERLAADTRAPREAAPADRLLGAEKALIAIARRQRSGRRIQNPARFDVDELRRSLGPARAFVELIDCRDRLRAVIVTEAHDSVVELGLTSRAVSAAATVQHNLARLASNRTGPVARLIRRSVDAALERLSGELVAPLLEAVDFAGEMVVSPATGLGSLPWTLLTQRSVCVVPSGKWYHTPPPTAVGGEPGRVAVCVVGNLDGAEIEGREVSALHRSVTYVGPGQTTIDAVLRECGRAELLHIACHAVFRIANPTLSVLRLDDGPLAAFELERLPRVPAAVVLAACSSGVARHYHATGDGLGLSTALLRAGSRAVVSSSLPLPDDSAATALTTVHRGLRAGDTIAASLAAAVRGADLDDPGQLVVAAAMSCQGRGDWTLASPSGSSEVT